ncbi:hypothetical protein HMPREF9370_0877 [Neisseria wadsworthii 9715]|uniref:Uncharacterized protein n=1 Tax=Neisseria wadsworthii 9715 TaxID=1030841 RepID=G4CP68_9NEIS|nr:hypothetical protein HMPREF9370_0877 [Neisseria wadsworthii 9715]
MSSWECLSEKVLWVFRQAFVWSNEAYDETNVCGCYSFSTKSHEICLV